MLRAHQLSLCPSSMLTEVPIRVAILYLGDSILIENAINKRGRVLEPWLAISMLASSFLDWCWNMSHPNGALQSVAADGLMTEHLPHGLTHDSSYPKGTFLLYILQVFLFCFVSVWFFLAFSAGGLGMPSWAASRHLHGLKWRGTESLWDRLLCLSLSRACHVWELEAHVPLEMFLRCLGYDIGIGFY